MKFKKGIRSQKTEDGTRKSGVGNQLSAGGTLAAQRTARRGLDLQPSEQGIALVITLILLSVTLFMAIAFLAISRRERGSVVTETASVTARLAADSALAHAEAQILATVLQTTNPYNFSLTVSTNYQNANGYDPNFLPVPANPLNVNYDYAATAGNPPLTTAQFLQNVANLLYLPRAPVYAYDRASGSNEFRYYLDLNRNRQFDDTRPDVPNVNNSGVTNGTITAIGDPQWIGVLERPDAPHGPNNKFLSRYAFIALPVGNTLDLNYIHNEAITRNVNTAAGGDDGFLRNQGIGSWEINLAAFLADLNTNEWGQVIGSPLNGNQTYYYYQFSTAPFASRGRAFDDARSLLSYRYGYNYNSLASVQNLFALGGNVFLNDAIDGYSDGSLQTTLNTNADFIADNSSLPWAGADNTNHYFSIASDLFDRSKITAPALNFIDHLENAGTSFFGGTAVSTYDRYTFYRLLAQLGTDSAPETDKMNLNYKNVVNGAIVPNYQTNFFEWTPVEFFTNAADRMLRAYTTKWFQSNPSGYLATYYNTNYNYYHRDSFGNTVTNDPTALGLTNVPFAGMTNQIPAFGLTEIPVELNGKFVYQPAVQRILQLAANINDARTNKATSAGGDYPTVFRPTFFKSSLNNNTFINGYEEVSSLSGLNAGAAPLDAPIDISLLPTGNTAGLGVAQHNIYGVPWIIGAKKGFPNFNEFSMQNVLQITRKLEVRRPATNSPPNATNQMYIFSITNSLGIECWNSYTNAYPFPNNLKIVALDQFWMQMSNGANPALFGPTFSYSSNPSYATLPVTAWPGKSFQLPLVTSVTVLTDSAYNFSGSFVPLDSNPSFATVATTPSLVQFPQTTLNTTNRLQVFMLDGTHVIDYVSFSGPVSSRNINSAFQNTNTTFNGNPDYYTNAIWSTAFNADGAPIGIATQIGISDGSNPTIGVLSGYWRGVTPTQVADERNGFAHFLNSTNSNFGSTNYASDLAVQVPYTPTINVYEYTTFQANDPLVHYLQSDLNYFGFDPDANSGVQTGIHPSSANAAGLQLLPDMGRINARYQPWGKGPPSGATGISTATYDVSPYNLAFKDPLVKQSDDWGFPTNKFPTAGWIGRVHRGTPWQTVYVKASNVLRETKAVGLNTSNIGTNTWAIWTGDTANVLDAVNTAPIEDRLLFDIFSAAFNDNATHGQLSVNVGAPNGPSLAAWSALFSGLVAITNTTSFPQFFPQTNVALIIQPAGAAGTNSELGRLVVGINNARAIFTNADGVVGTFEHVGDVLSTLQLSEQSPFLNKSGVQITNGINDALYEWLPQQIMSLLRVSNQPRFVIYSYGQTLTPSANGVVSSGGAAYSGMITNYQVVAETVTRSVVRIEGAPTNAHAVIESFNILPPD